MGHHKLLKKLSAEQQQQKTQHNRNIPLQLERFGNIRIIGFILSLIEKASEEEVMYNEANEQL